MHLFSIECCPRSFYVEEGMRGQYNNNASIPPCLEKYKPIEAARKSFAQCAEIFNLDLPPFILSQIVGEK